MNEFYSYLSSQPKTPLIEGVIKIYNVLFESVVSSISLYRDGQYVGSAQNIDVADDWAEADPCQMYTITDQNGIEHLWGSSLNNTDEIERNWIRDYPGSGDISRASYRILKANENAANRNV